MKCNKTISRYGLKFFNKNNYREIINNYRRFLRVDKMKNENKIEIFNAFILKNRLGNGSRSQYLAKIILIKIGI